MDDQRSDGTEREIPSPEVSEKPSRRRFTAEYKLRILAEADACTERGALGELLRREGLYSSHLSTWQKQREEGLGVDWGSIGGRLLNHDGFHGWWSRKCEHPPFTP